MVMDLAKLIDMAVKCVDAVKFQKDYGKSLLKRNLDQFEKVSVPREQKFGLS